MKTMFALLLIAGIVLAAQAGPAYADATRAKAGSQTWWQDNFGPYLSSRSFASVPWLDHVARPAAKSDGSTLLRLDTLEPFRFDGSSSPIATAASGTIRMQ